MQLSQHFTLKEALFSEAAIRHGLPNQPGPTQLANMRAAAPQMELVRALLGDRQIHVDSWFRSHAVNEEVGGSAASAHMDGWAIDFRCDGFGDPLAICKAIAASNLPFDQMIHEYGEWTHISFAPTMRRETLTIFTTPERKYLPGLMAAAEYAKHFT